MSSTNGSDNIQTGLFFVLVVIGLLLPFVLFSGEPDIVDAIIYKLMN